MSFDSRRPVSVLLIGGCGHWAAQQNHVPAILDLKRQGFPVRVSAICDPRDPYREALAEHMPHLRELVRQDRPTWIAPLPGEPFDALAHRLDQAHHDSAFDVVIVACSPVDHFPYLLWATRRGVHVLCDKPILCVEDAAWIPDRAAEIGRQFDAVVSAHRRRPGHLFAVPLRRRANDAFVQAAGLLRDVHDGHKQPLTSGYVAVNGGHFRLAEEYVLGDAHGYTHGVGALAFSSYHYLDVLAWYLQTAPGEISALRLTNQYVRRLRDHLATGQDEVLEGLLRPRSQTLPREVRLEERTGLAELDFGFTVEPLDAGGLPLGAITYSYASSSYSNRTVGTLSVDAENQVPFREKGRMSQYVIDLRDHCSTSG
jgi:predicted dehydrogenase